MPTNSNQQKSIDNFISVPQLKKQLLSKQIEAKKDQMIIRVVEYTEERKRSVKTGKSYTQIAVQYDWIDRPINITPDKNPFKYQTAGFAESGKAVREISPQKGDVYLVTTAVNDRDYEEWVKLEKLLVDDDLSAE